MCIRDRVHPYSKGRICGRGHGLAQMAYSDERVTQPLRRKDDGTFEPIDWDTAFKEIGAKVQDIIAKNGPESDVYKRQDRRRTRAARTSSA